MKRKNRLGVTPIIAVVILLLITVALAGTAWTYLSGYVGTQTQKTFNIVTNGAFCEGGKITVYIVNTGYQSSLDESDFPIIEIDAVAVPPINIDPPLTPGEAGKLIEYSCGSSCATGFYDILLSTSSTTREDRILCP
ncbi:MAG: hypothetical protein KKA90_04945 [Nanoarchaeota archaeon]|nr:hypothetical protein [Nanoarchaeota archaeon]